MSEKTELTLPERASVALGAPKYEQEIRDLVAKTVTITEVKNKDGREQCHGAMMTLKNTRVAIEKAAKAAREDATAFSKAVIAEEKRLVALAEPEESRLQGLRDEWDEVVAAEKAAIAAAEKARVDAIRKRIAEIQSVPSMLVGKPAETIAAAIESLEAVEITLETHQEFAGEAEMAKAATVLKLSAMLEAQRDHEAEQARLAAEREAIERQRAELAEQERKAEAARREQEAKDRAERERVAAEQRAAQEAAAAAMRAEQAAHEARMRAQQEEIDRQQAEINRAKAEQERIERDRLAAIEAEARAKREAEEAAVRAEAERKAAEERAKDAERRLRLRVEFEEQGPGDLAIVEAISSRFEVSEEVAARWLTKFDAAPFLTPYTTEQAA